MNNLQKPLNSNYGHFTTPEEIIKGKELKGKNVIITGGYTGTGLEITRALSSIGAHIIVLARDIKRAKRNLRKIKNIEIEYIDLLLSETIDDFCNKFLNSNRPLDILINNAGIINTPFIKDKRGYEMQFSTNYLGHYQLTLKLIPALKKSNKARIINTTSRGHRESEVHFDDIHFENREYNGMKAYGQSKTALILFTLKLDELYKAEGIRAYAVHPGPIPSSDLFAESMVRNKIKI